MQVHYMQAAVTVSRSLGSDIDSWGQGQGHGQGLGSDIEETFLTFLAFIPVDSRRIGIHDLLF